MFSCYKLCKLLSSLPAAFEQQSLQKKLTGWMSLFSATSWQSGITGQTSISYHKNFDWTLFLTEWFSFGQMCFRFCRFLRFVFRGILCRHLFKGNMLRTHLLEFFYGKRPHRARLNSFSQHSSRLAWTIKDELRITIFKTEFRTDSQIVFHQIQSECRYFATFVHRRMNEILKHPIHQRTGR